ncbi:GNAT family N-acetyltransferase [Micromonospora sp. NPDC050397]|uniref:GNAT family N-acetyltransferase n=1 Tax=Micromonospora sp. NPDC050397 TaxID=3364279 RepID=UPI0038503D97
MRAPLTSVDVTIRPLRPADVTAAVELLVLAAGAEKRHRLTSRLTTDTLDEIHHALVAERDGVLVGAAKLTTEPANPGTVSVLVAVAESARGEGVGTALAAELRDRATRTLTPGLVLTTALRDDLDRGRQFAERHGMVLTNHSVGWRFDLTGRGEEVGALAASAADRAGVRVRATDLASDEATVLECVGRTLVGLPVPGGEAEDVDLAHARSVIPERALVLLAEPSDPEGGPALGLTIVTAQVGTDDWYTVYTGVDVNHRGRGVATALKTAALRYAYDAGATAVTTHNDDTNEPILRANRALGMTPTTGYWSLVQTVNATPASSPAPAPSPAPSI